MRSVLLAAVLVLGSAVSDAALAASPPRKPWTAWDGGWVRLEADGNLSCFSYDGTSCAWHNSVADPRAVPRAQVRPLVCGTAHRLSAWKLTGYNDGDELSGDRHWCRSAYATLFAKWQDYSTLGAPFWLSETPAGDLMCHSTDGRHCTPVVAGDSGPPTLTMAHPLVCGAHHRKIVGNPGYDQPDHWCRMPRIVERKRNLRVTSSRRQIATPAWTAEDEPAVVVRARMPSDRMLQLLTKARFAVPWIDGSSSALLGFDAGANGRVIAGALDLPPPWGPRRTADATVIAGLSVTARGNLCFFSTRSGRTPSDQIFSASSLLGNSRQVALAYGLPSVRITGSPLRNPVVQLSTELGGADVHIDELLTVVARAVPVEGSTTMKRKIPYHAPCDSYW